MKCDELVQWLEEAGADVSRPLPDAVEAHCVSCGTCQRLLSEERLWCKFFSLAGETAAPENSVWPGVAGRIEEHERRRASLSDALLVFSRRLFPAFLLILVLLGGFSFWRTDPAEPGDNSGATMLAMLASSAGGNGPSEEPDAVLNAWLGANGQ